MIGTLAAAAATAAGVGLAAGARAARAEDRYPPLGRFVSVDGAPIHYVQEGAGPDVVLLHGAGGNLRDFTFDLVGRLAGRYRVTAFDRPGLGYSGRAPGVPQGPVATEGESPATQARLLRGAAQALDIRAPVVVGHSFGGIVGLAWALAGLERGDPVDAAAYVSLAGVALPWPGDLGPYYTVNGTAAGGLIAIPLIAALVPRAIVRQRVADAFDPNPAPDGYADYVGAALGLRPASFRANVRQVNTLRPHVVEMEPRYADLALPVEIVHGLADTTVPVDIHSRPFAARHANARLTELPGIGHMPHHAAPEPVVAAIDRAARRAGLPV